MKILKNQKAKKFIGSLNPSDQDTYTHHVKGYYFNDETNFWVSFEFIDGHIIFNNNTTENNAQINLKINY